MAKDFTLPFQDLTNLVPKHLRNPMAASLLDNLFNRFLTQDEAVPLYGYVGRKPSSTDDRTPKIPQQNVERDVNSLIPVFSFKVGAETHSFTPQDLIRKASVLGISEDQSSWLYSQANNYAPPIALDKFTNFFNYYWVADALPNSPNIPWNPSNAPEYYTISRPQLSDADKLNVRTATTSADLPFVPTGSGFYTLSWEVEFTSPTQFTVTAVGPLVGFAPGEETQGPFTLPTLTADPFPGPWPTSSFGVTFAVASAAAPLLTFSIVRDIVLDGDGLPLGYEGFAAGDKFTITAPFLSSTHTVDFTGSPGVKGKLLGIDSLDTYQTIGGVQVKEGDRVLVKDGANSNQYIWVVKPGAWELAPDFDSVTAMSGARVWVSEGANANTLFESSVAGSGWAWTADPSALASNTNDWQETNFWVKSDDLLSLSIDQSKAVQATRPIIEFDANLQLNSYVGADGLPADSQSIGAVFYEQKKTEFNQAPLFDLYRYDGHHSKTVSALFFYAEDPTAEIDPALQRRVKRAANSSADFLFDHGMIEGENSLLFYRLAGNLKTIWHAGYSSPTLVDQQYRGSGDGTLTVDVVGVDPFTPQQIWTLTATGPTTFKVSGSKTKVLPTPIDVMTVGVPYSNGMFNATIVAGPTPFILGDQFTFRIGNFETTRYVYRDENEQLFDFYGGPNADLNGVGAWQVPRMFYTNVAADNREEVSEGSIYSHFRGILANQLEQTTEDRAFGGSIKLWSEQQNLLAALLMERNLTPVSMIDHSQRLYETAVNSVIDLYTREIIQYLCSVEVLTTNSDMNELLDHLLALRAVDQEVRTVLYDSTSPIVGFPPTLPLMGVVPLVTPGRVFDNELGVTLLRCHDGHEIPLFSNTQDFRDRLFSVGKLVLRSDGTYTPAIGSYTTTPPTQPYKGEMWQVTQNGFSTIYVFDVLGDGPIAPANAQLGDRWYNRPLNQLFSWDGALWQPESSLISAWVEFDPAELLNDLLLEVEQRLYNGINPNQRSYFTVSEIATATGGDLGNELQRELATWAVTNGYDPTAPDYVSTDAFTWNYSGLLTSQVAQVDGTTVPARWYHVLQAHHRSFGSQVVPTSRPNLEPWKLLGNAVKPVGWDAAYGNPITQSDVETGSYIQGPNVKAVLYSHVPVNTALFGLQIVDGVSLTSGDMVLLVSEAATSNNGLWVVSSGGWSRAVTPLLQDTLITVNEGALFSGTVWWLSADAPVVNTDPVIFFQVRDWTHQMWLDIQAARPSLKLSVDTAREVLLPPYVSPAFPWSVNALTTALPPTPAESYLFGEGSPVETVWLKSVEYRYSLARALFRADPLAFLGHLWGFEWIEVDGILYDGFDLAVPGHPRFRLQGDRIQPVQRAVPFAMASLTGPAPTTITITHDAYTSTRQQSWTVRDAGGTVIGYLNEGAPPTTLTGNGYVLSNVVIEDEGRPFRIGDSFELSGDGTGPFTHVLRQAEYASFQGFGQSFTQALRASSIDTSNGQSIMAHRGWSANLGYRAGGLVSTDDLRVFTDEQTLPDSAYELRFKRSPFAGDLWVHALRVSVVQVGSSTTNEYGQTVATGNAGDWVFRVDGYNSRYLGIDYYTFSNGEEVSFYALGKEHTDLAWEQPTIISGLVSGTLPITITGLQNVVDFLFGYARRVEDEGWRFSDDGIQNIDSETGRVRGYQLEIEKLIDRVFAGIELGQGHVVNPFLDRVWVEHPTGLLTQYFDSALFDVTGHPAAFDTIGVKIDTSDLIVLRGKEKSMISSSVPMFTVHAQIDEYEHLFVFNNLSSPSTGEGLIYDPFSGARVVTIKLNGRRQAAQTLRPEFGGHYLVGDEVKRNLRSSVDKVAQYYDTDHVFEDELSTRHALALLGFSPKQYMSDLDLNERSQFNFWRGLVQMKGTNASIDAFLNNDRFEDAKLDEYWAYKVAEYGDSRSKVFPELKIQVGDSVQQFTKLIFDPLDTTGFETFTTISADDENRWFSIDDLGGETSFEAQVVGTYSETVSVGQIVLPFVADRIVTTGTAAFTKLNSTTLNVTAPGTLNVTGYGPATPKFNPLKLFNYVDAELVEEIPQWHPAIGQHTVTALESINVISATDPARYNVSTLVSGNSNYDPLRTWGAKEVGRVWWDTTNLDYLPYYDQVIFDAVDDRLSRWGTLADYATVDVVEWIESAVPPSEYDAQALIDAGNADLDPVTKADGVVYGAKSYSREREWFVRPVAWSYSPVPISAAHPALAGATTGKVLTLAPGAQSFAWLSEGLFEDSGISAGMRLGAWYQDTQSEIYYPMSEYLISGPITKYIPTSTFTGSASGLSAVITVSVTQHTDKIGQLLFSPATPAPVATQLRDADGVLIDEWDVATSIRLTEVESGESQVVQVRNDRGVDPLGANPPLHNATFDAISGDVHVFDFTEFGLRVTVRMTASAAGVDTDAMLGLLVGVLGSNVTMFDAAPVELVVPLNDPDNLIVDDPLAYSNDPFNPTNSGVQWRAWNVPTQDQLDADSRVPNSSWRPYIGAFTAPASVTIDLIQDGATNPSYTLNDGTVIERYQTSWGDWSELKSTTQRITASVTGNVTFQIPVGITIDRISVYVNGVAQLIGTYALSGTTLTVFNVALGHVVTVITRAYAPSAEELAFDPAVEDNRLVQRQYKTDYQYVSVPVRSPDGSINSTKYYFWVKNRSTVARKKNLSVKGITQLLITGPSQYMTFQHPIADGTGMVGDPYRNFRYDAIALSGLSYVVTKDDAFKLRFTRNFTLRDDPNELDLKDTHAEWTLIRPGQRTKIPEALWQKMVDAACGEDAGGNVLPSPQRIAYDSRNGTSTRYGFGNGQVLAPTELVVSTILFTILNTSLVDDSGSVSVPDYMTFLDFGQSDAWFATPQSTRGTLTAIWNRGKASQINEIFFAVLNDICAANYELSDLFKTSRLSAYSIKVVRPAVAAPTYE